MNGSQVSPRPCALFRWGGLVLALLLCLSWAGPLVTAGASQHPVIEPAAVSPDISRADTPGAALLRPASGPQQDTEHMRLTDHRGGYAGPVVVQGNTAYAIFATELAVLDISDPLQPVRLGYILLPDNIWELAVFGNYVFAAGSSLYIIDVAVPSSPVQIAVTTYIGDPMGVAANATHIFLSEGPVGSGENYIPGSVYIFDYSTPSAPVQVGYFATPRESAGLFATDRYLYLAARGDPGANPQVWGGLFILDISNPSTPQVMSFTATARFAQDVVVVDSTAYVSDVFSGLWIMGVSDPEHPVRLSDTVFGGESRRPGGDGWLCLRPQRYIRGGSRGRPQSRPA